LAVPAQEGAERLVLFRPEPGHPREQERDAKPITNADVPVAEQRPHAVADRGGSPMLVDHAQPERTPGDVTGAADPLEEKQVLGEAAERDVLAVVRRRLGIAPAARQRLNPAAQRRPRLEQGHLVAGVDELERRREPGEAAPDDRRLHRASAAPTTRSFVTGDSDCDPAKTSKPFFSIRSSVER
jgi:hypothetical protein